MFSHLSHLSHNPLPGLAPSFPGQPRANHLPGHPGQGAHRPNTNSPPIAGQSGRSQRLIAPLVADGARLDACNPAPGSEWSSFLRVGAVSSKVLEAQGVCHNRGTPKLGGVPTPKK